MCKLICPLEFGRFGAEIASLNWLLHKRRQFGTFDLVGPGLVWMLGRLLSSLEQ